MASCSTSPGYENTGAIHEQRREILLDISLLTGRTHQIRAHMSYIHHHVVGDIKYGDYKINNIFKREYGFENQFLHAYKLKFLDIKGPLNYLKNKEFSYNLPPELEEILKKLD